MLHKLRETNFWLSVLSWATLVFSITCYYANMDDEKYSILFSSDTVGLPCLYQDVVKEGGNIKDWIFAAAPCVFPDMVIFTIMKQTIDPSVQSGGYMYAVFQVILVCLLSMFVFRKMAGEKLRKYAWLIPVLFSTLYIESYYFSKDMTMGFLLSAYQYHAGAYINFLIGMSIYLSGLSNKIKYPLFLIFSAIAVFCDILYIVLLVFPLAASVFLDFKNKGVRTIILVVTCTAAGTLGGIYFFKYFKTLGIGYFTEPHTMMSADLIMPSLKIFTEEMIDYIKTPGLRSLLVLFTFSSMLICPLVLILKRKTLDPQMRFLLIFYTMFTYAVFAAPIVNGNYSGYDTIRYSIFSFYFTLILMAVFIGNLLEGKIKTETTKNIVSFSLPVLFLVMTIIRFSPQKLDIYFSYFPERVKDIDSVCAKYHLKKGLSEYWTSRQTIVFSKNRIKVLAVYPITVMNEFCSNKSYYFDSKFDFIIADLLDGASIQERFVIKDTIQTKTCKILLVDDFIFKPGEYFPFTPTKIKGDSATVVN
jgi:hypothetical protein